MNIIASTISIPKLQEKEVKTVTICGSTRFKKQIMDVAKQLTLKGYIVLLPLVFGHAGDVITEDDKKCLDKLHFEKIDMSSEVHVVMVDNYIGKSTKNEIEYSKRNDKTIIYHSFIGKKTKSKLDDLCERIKQVHQRQDKKRAELFEKAKEAEIYLFEKSNLSGDVKGMNLSDDLSRFIEYFKKNYDPMESHFLFVPEEKESKNPILPSELAHRINEACKEIRDDGVKWIPEDGERYYFPADKSHDSYGFTYWHNTDVDKRFLKNNLVCKTKEQAIELAEDKLRNGEDIANEIRKY
jgi:hypothetical protein